MRVRCEGAFRSAGWLVGLLVLAGCGGGGGNDDRIRLAGDGFAVAWDAEARALVLEREESELLRLPVNALQLGRVDAVSDEVNYDPYPLLAEDSIADYVPPKGLTWVEPTQVELAAADEASLELALSYRDGSAARLTVARTAAGRYRCDWQPGAGAEQVAYFRLAPPVDAAERFYGLGSVLDEVEHRGRLRAMQMELDLELESGYNEAHEPIPLLLSTAGWGLFVESYYPAVFDVAAGQADRLAVLVGQGPAAAEGLRFHLLAAGQPLDLTRHYYALTGAPLLPARWALGPWLWRDENEDQAQVLADAETLRDLDLATSGLWIDRPYARCVNSFDFDPDKFDAPQAMIARLHALGLRVALWHTPYLDDSEPACAALHQQAADAGYFPPVTGMLLNKWSAPMDLTNPEAYAWWQGLIERYTAMGIEGFKLDYAEDVVPGLLGVRNRWQFADGSDERTMHARYQLYYHRVYAETLPADGGFLLCRGATWGDQQNVSVIWPGDLDANMARHREVVENRDGETYVAVGGLPASLVFGLSLGPSGFAFYGSDTGGYRNSPPDKETFTRWFEQTALSSVMQVGTSSNDVAWEFDEQNGFDQEMLDWYRRYTRLHLRLWPYAWTLAQQLAETGRPLMRPFGLAYPDQGAHPNDVYLFGPDLLVAPVVERGAREKEVVFPPGEWLDWWNGEIHQGPGSETVAAPLDHLPLYLRRGGIVPLLRPTIDSMAPTSEPERVDSYATTPGVLHPRLAPGPASQLTLFDGTLLAQQDDGDGIALSVSAGAEFRHGVQFELIAFGAEPPATVTAGGAALAERADLEALAAADGGWFHDATAPASLHIKVGPGDHAIAVER